MPKPKKPIEVFQILHAHDQRFSFFSNRGKGSHRMIFHPDIKGQKRSFPMTFHKGHDIGKGMLKAIIRRFELPNDIFD